MSSREVEAELSGSELRESAAHNGTNIPAQSHILMQAQLLAADVRGVSGP